MKRKRKYKFGDKVTLNGEKGIITFVKKIPNESDEKYLDYLYEITFEDGNYTELSYEDFENGW